VEASAVVAGANAGYRPDRIEERALIEVSVREVTDRVSSRV
jgi:hypothetical protein